MDEVKNSRVGPAGAGQRIVDVKVRSHGPFAFSRQFDDRLYDLALQATLLNGMLAELPILPAMAAKLNEDLIVRSIFGTAAIEGSSLSEPEVSALLTTERGASSKSEREQVILNLREAYRLAGVGEAQQMPHPRPPLSEERIRKLHEVICSGLDHDKYLPGTYRFTTVEVGDAEHGGKYTPPKVPNDVTMLMARFVEWANSEPMMASGFSVFRAFLAHYHLALIHPFKDGNGRLARVVEAELLAQAGCKYAPLMMSNYYYENIDDYYRAFTAAEANHFDLTPFLEFSLNGLVRSLMQIRRRVTEQIRRLALRRHYDDLRQRRSLSERMYRFLLVLLDDDVPFSAQDLKSVSRFAALYAHVSSRTIARDLRKLITWKLLSQTEPGRYQLNLRVLG